MKFGQEEKMAGRKRKRRRKRGKGKTGNRGRKERKEREREKSGGTKKKSIANCNNTNLHCRTSLRTPFDISQAYILEIFLV